MIKEINFKEDLGLDPLDENGSLPRGEGMEEDFPSGVSSRPGKAIVIGAGVTGLTVAWQLLAKGMSTVVLEATRHVGGMSTTFRHKEFLLDFGPHKFSSPMQDRIQMIEDIIGKENFLTVPKYSRIRLQEKFLNYPLELLDVLKHLHPLIAVSGGLSYLRQMMVNLFEPKTDSSYQDWLVRRFGRKLYHLIFGPYAQKVWGDPSKLASELAKTRVAIPDLFSVIWHLLVSHQKDELLHAKTYRYPKFGTGEFSRRLAELVLQYGGTIRYSTPAMKLIADKDRICGIQTGSGEKIFLDSEDVVVTTMPLGYLSRLIEPSLPVDALQAASRLQTRHLILLYLVVNRPSVSNDSWIFFPEAKYLFTRVSEQKNFSPFMGPPDKTCLCLEIVVTNEKLWHAKDSELYDRAIKSLEETGLVDRTNVLEYFTKRLKWVYPVYDLDYRKNADRVLNALDRFSNFYSVGRGGGFNYVGQVDCLDIGLVTATNILKDNNKTEWADARTRFAQYIVLD